MPVTTFTPVASLIGGGMIGLAAVALMALMGRIAGVSGIASRLLPPFEDGELAGRIAFLLGLVIAPIAYLAVAGHWPEQTIQAGGSLLVIAGLAVGFGSVWGNGCTSGHGVCGLSRLSLRSLIAVLTFMSTAMLTVFFMRHIL